MKLEVLGYATQGILYNNNILLSIQILVHNSLHQIIKVVYITHTIIIMELCKHRGKVIHLVWHYTNIYDITRVKIIQTNSSSEIYTMHRYMSNRPTNY